MSTTIGVIGAGNMGAALIRGWLRSADPEISLVVYDVAHDRVQELACEECVTPASSIEEVISLSRLLVVVVKPKDMNAVFAQMRPALTKDKIVVSSAAGITLDSIRDGVGPEPAVFRLMPNLGVEMGEGVLALSTESRTEQRTIDEVVALLEALGVVELLGEEMFDAVTAASGSSIAFLALALEGMEDGAVKVGMPRATARAFVRQTALGTALLLQRYAGSAADIKDQVSSPGGTTIAGLAVLEDMAVRAAFLRAIEAATERSRGMRNPGTSHG